MWTKVEEDGQEIWVNEEVGNVIKTKEGQYVAAVPRIVRLGPFQSVDEAKRAAEDKSGLERALDTFNNHLVMLANAIRGQ